MFKNQEINMEIKKDLMLFVNLKKKNQKNRTNFVLKKIFFLIKSICGNNLLSTFTGTILKKGIISNTNISLYLFTYTHSPLFSCSCSCSSIWICYGHCYPYRKIRTPLKPLFPIDTNTVSEEHNKPKTRKIHRLAGKVNCLSLTT
jgi:hypothetical protein